MLISDFTPELLFSLRNDWNNQICILMQTSGDMGSNDFSGKYLSIEFSVLVVTLKWSVFHIGTGKFG